jgi:SAM-dependent methyltransferase
MIADVARLGYLTETDLVLDCTYGLGRWWTKWQPLPGRLIGTDLDPAKSPGSASGVDFRSMGQFADDAFDVVAFDPPYKLNGTPTASVDAPYGVDAAASGWERHQLIHDGLKEIARVVRPRGIVLLKCQDQVNGGKVRWQTREFSDGGEELGLVLVDMLHMIGHNRPQPEGRRQVHARHSSSLLIFRAPK